MRDQLYKYGRYTIGIKGEVHHSHKSGGSYVDYHFYYRGKEYVGSVRGGFDSDSIIYIKFDTTNPSRCIDVGSIPKCLWDMKVPAEGWRRLPYDPCK